MEVNNYLSIYHYIYLSCYHAIYLSTYQFVFLSFYVPDIYRLVVDGQDGSGRVCREVAPPGRGVPHRRPPARPRRRRTYPADRTCRTCCPDTCTPVD